MKKILVLLIGNVKYDARVSKEINSLIKFGYSVVLVQTEELQEVDKYNYKIYRIGMTRRGVLRKIKDAIAFEYRLWRIIHIESPEYIHCNDFNSITYAIPWLKRCKVVFDSHELAIECLSGFYKILYKPLERLLIPYFHAIIIPQIDRLRYFGFIYPSAVNKLFLLENFPTKFKICEGDFFRDELNIIREDNRIVLYTGRINVERRIIEIVEAIKYVPNVILVIIGFADAEYLQRIKKVILENSLNNKVYIFEPLRHEKIKKAAMSADIGVCFYDDPNLNSYFCASNKLYELMDSGTLVLTNDTVGAARVLKEENGICINEISIDNIVNGLLRLTQLRPAPKMNYWWENQEHVLKQIYR